MEAGGVEETNPSDRGYARVWEMDSSRRVASSATDGSLVRTVVHSGRDSEDDG